MQKPRAIVSHNVTKCILALFNKKGNVLDQWTYIDRGDTDVLLLRWISHGTRL